jgi:hypothetical protein
MALNELERGLLEVQRCPVAANTLRWHPWGHIRTARKKLNAKSGAYEESSVGSRPTRNLLTKSKKYRKYREITSGKFRRLCKFCAKAIGHSSHSQAYNESAALGCGGPSVNSQHFLAAGAYRLLP